MSKTRKSPPNHVSQQLLDAVTNHEEGTCTFELDTIPEKGLRTIDLFQGDERLFSISISDTGVCYQVLSAGEAKGCFTLWEDEV